MSSIPRFAAAAAWTVLSLVAGVVAPTNLRAGVPDALPNPGAATQETPLPVLFRRVTIVPLTSERVDVDRDVLVGDGRIARIAAGGTIRAPRGARDAGARAGGAACRRLHSHGAGTGSIARRVPPARLRRVEGVW